MNEQMRAPASSDACIPPCQRQRTRHPSQQVVKALMEDRGAHGVVVRHDGSRAYSGNLFAGIVSAIGAATQFLVRSARLGSAPGGVTCRADSR